MHENLAFCWVEPRILAKENLPFCVQSFLTVSQGLVIATLGEPARRSSFPLSSFFFLIDKMLDYHHLPRTCSP